MDRKRPATAAVARSQQGATRASRQRTPDPRARLGLRIKDLRAQNGVTQEELAERCGIFRTYMSRIESGQANPTLTMLYEIAAGLGVAVVELFSDVQSPVPRRVLSAEPRPARGRVRK